MIFLNINWLNSPIKRYKLKNKLEFRIHSSAAHKKDTWPYRIRKKVLQPNDPKRQAGVAILIFNNIDFKPKVIKRNRGYKRKIPQDDISILDIYAPNTRTLTFVKGILLQLKSHNDLHTLRVEDLHTPFLPMDKSSRQKLNREYWT